MILWKLPLTRTVYHRPYCLSIVTKAQNGIRNYEFSETAQHYILYKSYIFS